MQKLIRSIGSIYKELRDGDIRMIVYSLSYVTILSIVPFLVVSLGLFKWTGFLEFLYPKVESYVLKSFGEVIGPEVSRHLKTLLRRSYAGQWGFVSVIFLTFTTFRLSFDLQRAFNRVWGVKNPKQMGEKFFKSLFVVLIFPLLLGIDVLLRGYIKNAFGVSSGSLKFLSLFLLWLVLWALFYLLPNIKVKAWQALLSSAVCAGFLFLLQLSFNLLNKKVFSYSKFYGSLASFPLFMVWVSSLWFVILLGVSLNKRLAKIDGERDGQQDG